MALILVVEDNEANAEVLIRRLKRAGHDVLHSLDGRTGVDMTKRHKPDLVLMDMSLPVMDGWTATRLLKADERVGSIPVLALTARAEVGQRQRAMEAGCDDCATKPIDWEQLGDVIHQMLSASTLEVC